MRRGRALGELDKVREVRNVRSKFIRKAKASYYSNLGLKLSDPNTGQKYFWTTYKKLINKKVKTNIPHLMENGVFISNCRKRLIYSINILQINALSMIMVVFYRILSLKLMHRYSTFPYPKNKLLI